MVQKSVLISDDDVHVTAALARLFRAGGYDVITDLNSDVVELAKQKKPSLILLDLVQNTDGRILLGQLKRNPATADIPVVVLSGVDHPYARTFCRTLGAVDFVQKPFGLDLIQRVGDLAT